MLDHRSRCIQYVSRQMITIYAQRKTALRPDRLYQYRFTPPPPTPGMGSISIPEWGEPSHVNDPDYFRLQDLQEFQSTDFHSSLTRARLGAAEPRPGKRVLDDPATAKEPVKRPRLDNACILDFIPQVCAFYPGRAVRLTVFSHISYQRLRATFGPWIPAKFRLITSHRPRPSLHMTQSQSTSCSAVRIGGLRGLSLCVAVCLGMVRPRR